MTKINDSWTVSAKPHCMTLSNARPQLRADTPGVMPRRVRGTLLAALLSQATFAIAHPTWFLAAGSQSADRQAYTLGTGHHFPRTDHAVPARNISHLQCTDGTVVEVLSTRAISLPAPPVACWARLTTQTLQLSLKKGLQHFRENRVAESLQAQLQQDGLLRETYFKLPQTSLLPINASTSVEPNALMLHASPIATALVMKNAQPVEGQWVSLACPSLPTELWQQSDSTGAVDFSRLLQPLAQVRRSSEPELCLLHAFETRRLEGAGDQPRFSSQFVSSPWTWAP